MSGCCTPIRSAIPRMLAALNPFSANSASAASRIADRVVSDRSCSARFLSFAGSGSREIAERRELEEAEVFMPKPITSVSGGKPRKDSRMRRHQSDVVLNRGQPVDRCRPRDQLRLDPGLRLQDVRDVA